MEQIFAATAIGVKLMILIGLVVYTIFAGIMVRQEQLMADVLEESFEPIVRLLVVLHLAASIALIFFVFIIL